MTQKQVMLQPLMVEPLLVHSIRIIIPAVTGRTETEKHRVRVAWVVVDMGCVQIDSVGKSGTLRFPLAELLHSAPGASPPCVLFTCSG